MVTFVGYVSNVLKFVLRGLVFMTFLIAFVPFIAKSQNVVIPDTTFKNWILNNIAHPANTNEISLTEAAAYTGKIAVSAKNISNLSGIEFFTAIDSLDCSYNNITSLNISTCKSLLYLNCNNTAILKLDVSSNTVLRGLYCGYTAIDTLNVLNNVNLNYLFCGFTDISNLDVSKNKNLLYLGCNNTKISSLNVTSNGLLQYLFCGYSNINNLSVSNNILLKYLGCNNSNISLLNVTKNTALEFLSCNNTGLNNLNVTSNTALQYLYCGNTFLSSIDVSNNKQLIYFGCNNSRLTTLDVTNNSLLNFLGCNNNSITTLDVSKNTALKYLYCGNTALSSLNVLNNILLNTLSCNYSFLSSLNISANNLLDTLYCNHDSLTSLNMENGNNKRLAKFTAKNNLILTCIEVDTVVYANTNWKSFVDTIAQFSTHCAALPVNIISFTAFEQLSGYAFLEWTVSDFNSNRFVIERSNDGIVFSKIGNIVSQVNGMLQYHFQDNNIELGIVYYRLKMLDSEGKYSYSKVVTLNKNNNNQPFTIYPVPVINELSIFKTISVAEPVNVSLYDIMGNVLYQKSMLLNAGSNTFKIPTIGLLAGTYYLRIKGNTFMEEKMFLK